MIFKFALFLCFLYLSPSVWGEEKSSSSPEIIDLNLTSTEVEGFLLFVKGLFQLGYEANKLDLINELIYAFKSDPDTPNITLLATQNVYNDDGSVKEVRTIELFVPKLQEKSIIDLNLDQKEKTEFDADDYEQLDEIGSSVKALSMMGLDSEFVYTDKDKAANVEKAIFFNKDTSVIHSNGLSFINKTVRVANTAALEHTIQAINKGNLPVSVLKFDKLGNFLKEKSQIVPELLAAVSSDEGEASADFIELALQGLTESFLESHYSKQEITERLQDYLTKHVPDTLFTVTSDEPDGQYISKDYGVTLNYDLADTENSISYSVYANKLSKGQ